MTLFFMTLSHYYDSYRSITYPIYLSILPLPPKSTLFPYTTLFRSDCRHALSVNLADRHQAALHQEAIHDDGAGAALMEDRKSTRLNSSHMSISYAVFCLKKKNN